MNNPQLEEGHVKIANEIFDKLCCFRIPGEARLVLDCIIRKTYGYNKKEDWISNSQLVKMTGMLKGNVSRELSKLITNKIVIKSDNKLRLNKKIEEWKSFKVIKSDNKIKLSKVITGVIKSDNLELSKVRDTKDNITKDNIQKTGGEAKEILDSWNKKHKKNLTSTVGFEENLSFWLTQYSLQQMIQAINNMDSTHYWIEDPTTFFRRKNPNRENVDYIGKLLSHKTPKSATSEYKTVDQLREEGLLF